MAANDGQLQHVAPFAPETRVRYFDSREAHESDDFLDDHELKRKLTKTTPVIDDGYDGYQQASEIASSSCVLVQVPSSPVDTNNHLTVSRTSTGSPVNHENPLQISVKMLRWLTDAGLVHARMGVVYNETRAHHSLFVEYDKSNTTPVAVHVLLRAVMRTDSIHCALRIRLKDYSSVCLLSAELARTIKRLRRHCIQHIDQIKDFPLQLIHDVIEETTDALNTWIFRLWKRVDFLEDSTGMSPRQQVARANSLSSRKLTILLRDLHAVHVELRIALTNVKSTADLQPWLLGVMEKLEELRVDIGGSRLKPGLRAHFEDQARFNENVLPNMAEKVTQLLNRVNSQINVTYSLIAQKGNEQNYQIAKLTAADSRTMKAITVLTLTFLPGTMLASLWDAGIFTLGEDKSWKIYLGTTSGLTVLVFALWFLYVKVATRATLVGSGDEEKRSVDQDWQLYNAGRSMLL